MTEQTWFGIAYLLLGFLCIGLGFPLLAGRIGRNRWYGFRIPKAYASDEYWLRINQYGARHLIRWSSVIAALGAFLIIARDLDATIARWIIIGAPLLLLIPVVLTLLYARKLP